MTEEQAIKIRSCFANGIEFKKLYTEGINILADELNSAIKKQIPKNPKGETDPMFGDVRTVCPNCGNGGLVNPFSKSKVYDYCPMCGQALDWSDTE